MTTTPAPTAWLTPDEVQELTARQRWRAQCRALAAMGIPFRPNAVGRPLVERAHARRAARIGAPSMGRPRKRNKHLPR